MNTKYVKTLGKYLISIILLTAIFIFLEITDNHTKITSTYTEFKHNLLSKQYFSRCFEVWKDGDLTIAGFITLFILVIAIFFFVKQSFHWIRTEGYQNRRAQNLKLLGSFMFLLWSIGLNLYLQAFLYFPSEHVFVNSELLLRSAVSSLNLFMLDIDSNILDILSGNALLKGAISFVCLLSFICTVALLVSLVSARLWAYFKLNWDANVNKSHSHLYLFFGLEKKTEILAKSIREEDKKSIRIFIEKTKNDENDGKEGWNHLLAMLTHRRETFKKAKDLDARLALTNCCINSLEKQCGEFDVLSEVGLDDIKRKINQLKKYSDDAELHIFFLSEDEGNNIESTSIIIKDLVINEVANNRVKVIVYCHARRNSITRVIEQASLGSKIEVRIIDTTHLAVEELKTKDKTNLQPINFVNIEEDGTTASEFNALVIGFSEMGQDVVRFLYEYGSFVYFDKSNGIRRSPFCCHVVDSNMNIIEPQYTDTHMRMEKTRTGEHIPLISVSDDSRAFINLHSFGYKDKEFIKLLDRIIDKLNYVVIAIGEDIEGTRLAIWLLKHAMRKKKELKNFKILLPSYSPEKLPHIREIIDYYNGLFYAEIVNKTRSHNQNEQILFDNKIIHIFGIANDIYSYKSIVSNQIRKESWLYYNSYYGVIEKTDNDFAELSDSEKATGRYCSESHPDYAWNIRRQNELKITINKSPLYSKIMSIRRKEAQDMENALHRHTKRIVAKKALGNEEVLRRIESGIRHQTITRDNHNKYFENQKELKDINSIMTTLAQMEHLRWIASHEMLGYVWGPEKDEAHSEHECLVCWEKLASDIIRGYDYEVIDRSFRLADEEIENELKKDEPRCHKRTYSV